MADYAILNEKASDGFLKVVRQPGPAVPADQRAALIRKGNELFNRGDITTARRIFMTVRYGDGLIRVGDWFAAHNEPLEAIRMYWIGGDEVKKAALVERFAGVIRQWIQEDA